MPDYEEFEASRDLPCPACGAKWYPTPGTKNGRTMDHAKDCAYIDSLDLFSQEEAR